MSSRSAARGTAAASSIRLTLRTSNAVAPATPAPRAASCFAKEAVPQGRPEPPLPLFQPHPSPRLRRIKGGGLRPHQPSRPQEFLMGGKVPDLTPPGSLLGAPQGLMLACFRTNEREWQRSAGVASSGLHRF